MNSKYGNHSATPHQYLAELMCEKIAAKQKKALPWRFWQDDAWKTTFAFQAVAAAKLLKQYDLETISRAVSHPRAYWLYSFGATKAWKPILDEVKAQINRDTSNVIEVNEDSINSQPRQPIGRRNLLKDLD